MGWTVCNAAEEHRESALSSIPFLSSLSGAETDLRSPVDEIDLWNGGITFHHLSLIVGGVCALMACGISFFLIMGHAMHYSRPIEQRQLASIVPMKSLRRDVADRNDHLCTV